MEQPNIFMSYLRVTQHMSQQFRSHFGRLDLTFPQALVLTVLGEDGPVPISALAERTGSANSTVSGIVDRLEKLIIFRWNRKYPADFWLDVDLGDWKLIEAEEFPGNSHEKITQETYVKK